MSLACGTTKLLLPWLNGGALWWRFHASSHHLPCLQPSLNSCGFWQEICGLHELCMLLSCLLWPGWSNIAPPPDISSPGCPRSALGQMLNQTGHHDNRQKLGLSWADQDVWSSYLCLTGIYSSEMKLSVPKINTHARQDFISVINKRCVGAKCFAEMLMSFEITTFLSSKLCNGELEFLNCLFFNGLSTTCHISFSLILVWSRRSWCLAKKRFPLASSQEGLRSVCHLIPVVVFLANVRQVCVCVCF